MAGAIPQMGDGDAPPINQPKPKKGGRECTKTTMDLSISVPMWTQTRSLLFLSLQSAEATGVCYDLKSQGGQRRVAWKVWGSIWHLINQNAAMLPLPITVMLQEKEEGERCVWWNRPMGKWGAIMQAFSQTFLSVCLCEFMATVWKGKIRLCFIA